VKEYEPQNGNLGMIDLEGKGSFVYALAPGNATAGRAASVSVWDVSGGKGAAKEVQNFMPKGVSDTVQGMAVL
jgi:flagellar basal body P-ring protein FlgI